MILELYILRESRIMCNKPVISTTTTTKAYHVAVDNNDKATEFKFFSAKRPHMRTFYISLVTMFVGMWIWTSVAPLQIAIENTTNVSDSGLKRASTCSVLGKLKYILHNLLIIQN